MAQPKRLTELRRRKPTEWLRERDVDLLICSELHVDGGPLQRLFLGGWNGGVATFGGAWVSHRESDGETDIVVSFVSESEVLVFLVENKISAGFQPGQPQRYRERAMRWKEDEGPAFNIETVLLAPADYFGEEGSEIFDRQITYEDLIDVLRRADDARSRFLAVMLEDGIESHKEGYVAVPDMVVTEVWQAFWQGAEEETPRLRMRRPGSMPSGAGFIYFFDADGVSRSETGGKAHIVYKFSGNEGRCYVDAQFRGTTEAELRAKVGDLLEHDMFVVRAGRSASIRVVVPFVDFRKMPEGQEAAIEDGLLTAERIRDFVVEKGLLEMLVSW